MKFSLVAKGPRAEQAGSFVWRGATVPVLFRPLSVAEEMGAETAALRACKAAGAAASPGNPLYESARMVAILERGCLDPDSPPGDRQSLFDGGTAQISDELDTDTMGLLYEQHQVWQEQCSPSYRQKTDGQLYAMVKALAEEAEHDPLAFLRLSPKTRLTCALFMASLLRRSPAFNTTLGSSSDASPPAPANDPRSAPSSREASSNSPTAIPEERGA